MKPYKPPEIQGWMTDPELQWLYKQACQMDSIIEVGCWKGKSTHALLSGCPGKVFAIDHFKGSPNELDSSHAEAKTSNIELIFLSNVAHFPNLELWKMESVEAARLFGPRMVDMAFIDGCHLYEDFLADLKAWRPKCRKLLCGHDFGQAGVARALKTMSLEVKRPVDSIWSVNLE